MYVSVYHETQSFPHLLSQVDRQLDRLDKPKEKWMNERFMLLHVSMCMRVGSEGGCGTFLPLHLCDTIFIF
jgi:DNA topoisomerase IB